MLGIWLEEQQLSLRDDIKKPIPKDDEALIRLVQAGICNTDLELCKGYYPYSGILGHEFVGIVEECTSNPALIGQRVCGDINASCGKCSRCTGIQSSTTTTTSTSSNKRDDDDDTNTNNNSVSSRIEPHMPSHCMNRTVLGIVNHHGCFANYLCLPYRNLFIVPEVVSDDAATFVEPLAAALEIQEQITIEKYHNVLVIGDGKLGQLVAQATKAVTDCQLLVIGKHAEKLNNLRQLGIDTGIVNEINIIPGTYDIAIECTGNTDGFQLAISSLRPRGTLVLKSTYAGKLEIDASTIVVNEITIIGSRCGPFQKAIDLLANPNYTNKINVTNLIHARYPLSDGLVAFDHARTKGTMKILLQNK